MLLIRSMLLGMIVTCGLQASLSAAVQTKEISYEHDGVKLKGVLAWDDSHTGPRPGVLVVHEWWGLNDYIRMRAEKLAEQGYVAFALDMYGEGKETSHPQQAGQWASQVRSSKAEWRARGIAGLEVLKEQENVDSENLAVIGYCFGGSTALQLAYADVPVKGAASFHGALVLPEENENVSAKILICHGVADAMIPPEKVQEFQTALDQKQADYVLVEYAQARHAFTNPDADSHGIDNLKYDAKADQRSWNHLLLFLQEVFSESADS